MTSVKSIIRRYHRAIEEVVDARIAFDNLHSVAPAHCVVEWESEIETAEADRIKNPGAMDVMHSKIKSGQTMKQITTHCETQGVGNFHLEEGKV